MKFTIVYTAEDNGEQHCYGMFSTRARAERVREKWSREIGEKRGETEASRGDSITVCCIERLSDW